MKVTENLSAKAEAQIRQGPLNSIKKSCISIDVILFIATYIAIGVNFTLAGFIMGKSL